MKGYKGVMVKLSVMLAMMAGVSSVWAAGERVIASPLSPRDKATYGLPAATVASQGLWNVGVGETIHLEAQVSKRLVSGVYTDVVVTDVTWVLTAAPAGSAAAIGAPVMTPNMPIYEVNDRASVQVAGRATLIPDVAGLYQIDCTITTTEYGATACAQVRASAANYVGEGHYIETAGGTIEAPTLPFVGTPVTPECGVCHVLDNKIKPWQGTGHATKLTREIANLESEDSHFSGNCLSCHTVGYNKTASAVNGGFDDVAQTLGWTFPTTLGLDSWNNMPVGLKKLGNIQCENCHGPGSQHNGAAAAIDVNYGVGVCASCHDSGTHHVRPTEWKASGHAILVGRQTPPAPGTASINDCARCHSSSGFVNFANPRFNGQRRDQLAEAIGCAACHNPHSNANAHQVRSTADITLMNGEVIADGELGKLCMQCHMNRRDSAEYVKVSTNTRGPHHSVQADMLAGTNGVQFGKYIPASSGHLLATEDACATCHMQVLPATLANGNANPAVTGGIQAAGGHTFKMAWMNGDTEVEEPGVCAECHGEQEDFDLMTRKDYDGDGVIEGIQTEIQDLLDQLAALLPKNASGVPVIQSTATEAVRAAVYNWMFVSYDGSNGVHNPQYAAGVLKASIEAVGGGAPAGGPLGGGVAIGGGWVQSAWFGAYSPIFDGNWVFHQYHGPLYVNPNPELYAQDYPVQLWDPIIGKWLLTTPTLYPTVMIAEPAGLKAAVFTHQPDGRRVFTPTNGDPAVDYPGFSFDPANMNP